GVERDPLARQPQHDDGEQQPEADPRTARRPDRSLSASRHAPLERGDRAEAAAYVPWVQEARYASCSAVRVSIWTSIDASLSRAISSSMSRGTTYTFRSRRLPCLTMYSTDSAWFAKLMSITIAGCPSAAARLISRPSPRT